MLKAVLITLRFIILIFAGHQQVVLENAALRQQLAILKREQPRPTLNWMGSWGTPTTMNFDKFHTLPLECEPDRLRAPELAVLRREVCPAQILLRRVCLLFRSQLPHDNNIACKSSGKHHAIGQFFANTIVLLKDSPMV